MAEKKKKDDHYGRIIPKKKRTPKEHKKTKRDLIMADVTHSNVPKTAEEKRMWIQARRFVAKETGRSRDEDIPWGLVQTIYENQKKSGHIMHDKDIEDAKESKVARSYKDPEKERRKKEIEDKYIRDDDGHAHTHSEKYERHTNKFYGSSKPKKMADLKKKYRG